MKLKQIIGFLVFTFLLTHCETEDTFQVDYKYGYFPTQIGKWAVYDVDSLAYNNFYDPVRIDTYRFQIKEIIESNFTDDEGRKAQRIVRYKRSNSSEDWQINRAWHQLLTKRKAERIEENVRYIKLIFPPVVGATWKGNSYIDFDDSYDCEFLDTDWDYEYLEVDVPKTIGDHIFDSTLTVQNIDEENFVCKTFWQEIYAKNIGLVKKEVIRLHDDDITDRTIPIELRAEEGYLINYNIVDYGQE